MSLSSTGTSHDFLTQHLLNLGSRLSWNAKSFPNLKLWNLRIRACSLSALITCHIAFFRHYYYIAALVHGGCLLVDSASCYVAVFSHYRGPASSTTTFTFIQIHPSFSPHFFSFLPSSPDLNKTCPFYSCCPKYTFWVFRGEKNLKTRGALDLLLVYEKSVKESGSNLPKLYQIQLSPVLLLCCLDSSSQSGRHFLLSL